MSKSKSKLSREDIISHWLELYPIRELDFEMNGEAQAVVIVPHKKNRLLDKILPNFNKPAAKIRLDKVGTFIWKRCDGNKTTREICGELLDKFGKDFESVEERTVMFLQQMYKHEFIRVYKKKTEVLP
jgi:hypothetical protein